MLSFLFNTATIASNNLGFWTRVADFGGSARQFATAFSIDTLGYVGLGGDSTGMPTDFWNYYPATDTWSTIHPFPLGGRTSPIAFSNNSFGYVGSGYDSSYFKGDLFRYNPAVDSWFYVVGNWLGSFPARTEAVAFAIGDLGYITTGVGGASVYYNDLMHYSMSSDTFAIRTPGNTLPNPRFGAVAFSLNGYGYMGLGIDDSTYYNDFWKYDPIGNAWTQEADFGGTPRFGSVAFSVCNYGYVGLGEDLNSTYRQDFWRYDPTSNSWTFQNHFPGTGRRSAVAFTVNNMAYIGTGWDANGRTKDFYRFSCDSTSGIPDITQNSASSALFPNPNNGCFEVEYDLQNQNFGELIVTDINGKNIATYPLPNSKGNLKINQSGLKNGIYFYSIKSGNSTLKTGRFFIGN